jgi:hypothetical protein
MDCLGCLLITEKPITLRDGRIVCNECEAWRLECEARHAMTLRDKAGYLKDVRPNGVMLGITCSAMKCYP